MRGTIKFYSREKGYGFIYTDAHEKDIFFRIEQWKNHSAPSTDDIVEFDTQPGHKGLQAINIKCLRSAAERKEIAYQARRAANDDRVSCPHCNRKMVPRVNFYRGQPEASYCPYCGGKVKSFGDCFIATAVYKDYDHPKVLVLRRFRDQHLNSCGWGRRFIAFYYKRSPVIAEKLKGMPKSSIIIKFILSSFASIYSFFYWT